MHRYTYIYTCSCMVMWMVVETDDSMIDMSQSLEGATIMTVPDTNHPTHEEATALNQVTNDIHINYIIAVLLCYRKMLRVIMRQLKCLNRQKITQMNSAKEYLIIIIQQ